MEEEKHSTEPDAEQKGAWLSWSPRYRQTIGWHNVTEAESYHITKDPKCQDEEAAYTLQALWGSAGPRR